MLGVELQLRTTQLLAPNGEQWWASHGDGGGLKTNNDNGWVQRRTTVVGFPRRRRTTVVGLKQKTTEVWFDSGWP